MDLARFHRSIHLIDIEITDVSIESKINLLIQDLNAISSNPTSNDLATVFKNHVDELRQLLNKCNSNQPDADLKKVIQDLELNELLGIPLAEKIISTIQENQLSPLLTATALGKLRDEITAKLDNISKLNDAFSQLDVEYFYLPEGQSEMAINLPIEECTKTLEDLAKEAKEWHQICQTISETFDIDRLPVTVRTVASGSWLLYLAGTPTFIYGVAKCLKHVNQVLAELIKMKELYSQLAQSSAPKEALEILEKHNDETIKKELDKLANDLINNNYKGEDDGRKNELRNALSFSLNKLSNKIVNGAKVQLKLEKPEKPEMTEGETPTEEKIDQMYAYEQALKIQSEIDEAQLQLDVDSNKEVLLAGLLKNQNDLST